MFMSCQECGKEARATVIQETADEDVSQERVLCLDCTINAVRLRVQRTPGHTAVAMGGLQRAFEEPPADREPEPKS